MATLHILVQGKVQGVFFRASAKRVADDIGITGTVRNTDEGHVEIMATGSALQLEKFISWCNKGPLGARVEYVQADRADDKEFEEFVIIKK